MSVVVDQNEMFYMAVWVWTSCMESSVATNISFSAEYAIKKLFKKVFTKREVYASHAL